MRVKKKKPRLARFCSLSISLFPLPLPVPLPTHSFISLFLAGINCAGISMINDIELSLPAQLSAGVASLGLAMVVHACLFFAIRSFCYAFSTNLCTNTFSLPSLPCEGSSINPTNTTATSQATIVSVVYTRLALLSLLVYSSIASLASWSKWLTLSTRRVRTVVHT